VKKRIGDRRLRGRFEVVGTLPGTLETWQRLGIRNLAAGGALIESSTALPAGSRISGRLSLRGQTRQVRGEVRHVSADRNVQDGSRYLIGIEWVEGRADLSGLLAGEPMPPRGADSRPGVERRRAPRLAATRDAQMSRPAWTTVEILDISTSGVLFEAPQSLEVGERGQLRMRLGDRSFAAEIEVRREEPHPAPSGGYRVGAAFTALDDGNRATLEGFIGTARN
jgi:hypothetical protein